MTCLGLEDEQQFAKLPKLSTFLEIEDGIEYVINQFESRTFFSPVLCLELARAYRIDTWIDPGFRELVKFPIVTITLDDASRVGMITFFHLVLTKSKIEELQKGMAYNCPPVIHSSDCQNATECELAWSNEWWDGLAPCLLHPDTVYSGREVLASLERLSIADVGDGCHEETLKSLRLKGVFTRDADYMNEAVDELMRHQTDQPIREKLTESLAQ